ncbi:hypothetical protein MPSEU_000333100 [Mayamaea pseudoterrestris]|nr:hypothetical protein MPSEU_000333100 [Mayamaea pseudoterrestris]
MPSEVLDAPDAALADDHVMEDEEEDDHETLNDDEMDDEEAPAIAVAAEDGDDYDDDAEVMAAAEVVADNDEDDIDDEEIQAVPVVAIVAPTPKKKKKKATPATPKSGASKASSIATSKGNSSTTKTKKKKPLTGVAAASLSHHQISPLYLEAASDARAMLQETVPSLPMPIADITVRSFGRLLIDSSADNNFCTTAALYPIGFSCDRYEFSPAHGRSLKLRCSILDGRKFEPKVDGPLFRIVWGPGIDDENGHDDDHAFDPHVHAPPLSATPLELADYSAHNGGNATKSSSSRKLLPQVGMRVKVRLERSVYINGTIVAADDGAATVDAKAKKKRRTEVKMTIRYDEGFTEEAVYPDPDIELLLTSDDAVDASGSPILSGIRGKPVTCVVDASPLEAWGKALVELGLIDELMNDAGLEAVKKLREEALQKARDRMQQGPGSHTKLSRRDRASSCDNDGSVTAFSSRASSPAPSLRLNGDDSPDEHRRNGEARVDIDIAENEEVAEPLSEREIHLKQRVDDLKEDLDEVMDESQEAALALADARISLLGPFLCNPFRLDEISKAQQVSWMATAIKKEKLRMGSTGNKKKVVSPLDLLERNDTFYNSDIEALIEGLPGSEYCDSYVFQAFRAAGFGSMNKSWVHDAQLKREKEEIQRLKKSQEAQEKVQQEIERLKKRKHRDDVRDSRKRQKLEEEDVKKRARAEERLSRLRVQVEERLFNEATFQREKVVATMLRNMLREFARRRRAAELVAGQSIIDHAKNTHGGPNASYSKYDVVDCTLPLLLSTSYDEDTLRVWDFMASFGNFFLERGFIKHLPTLDALQSAVEALRNSRAGMKRASAVALLTNIAMALCQPLAANLTRTMFASLIALNPNLQKDFGAGFFNEVSAATPTKSADRRNHHDVSVKTDILFPVNVMTWQEIARASLLSDALGELGLQRHEAAHILRGYRSSGHPNSKEARRLRKIEDIWIAIARQEVETGLDRVHRVSVPIRTEIPCAPICPPGSFHSFLHNIKASEEPSVAFCKLNITKSLSAIRKDGVVAARVEQGLEAIIRILDAADAKENPKLVVKRAKGEVLKIFDMIGRPGFDIYDFESASASDTYSCSVSSDGKYRRLAGLLNSLPLTKTTFKKLVQERQGYMEEALTLKKELIRHESNGEGDDADDDDDEEDEEGPRKDVKSLQTQTDVSVAHGAGISEVGNGQVQTNDSTDKVTLGENKIGKPTDYDDFCGDIVSAPELIRRCLAVLRTLCVTSQASSFLFPVDPQSNPGYYDAVLRPICLRTIGTQLQEAASKAQSLDHSSAVSFVETVVRDFGRNMRLLEQNTLAYANAGPTVVAMASEFIRLFERLFFDWVLAPQHVRPALIELDDDKCVQPHTSDDEATVLVCDGCEGKYNITRLDPPLAKVPKGDWYCPRCVSGRCYGMLDPRIGKTVTKLDASGSRGMVESSCFVYHENHSLPSLVYAVKLESGVTETWSREEIDAALKRARVDVPPVECLQALAESAGYGDGVDNGLYRNLVPIPLNPNLSDSAAQVALSSSVFTDTLAASGTLLVVDPNEMTATEWMRILVLLTMKCSSSELVQGVIAKMESEAAESMTKPLEQSGKVNNIRQILPEIFESNDQPDVDNTIVPLGGSDEAPVSNLFGERSLVATESTNNGKPSAVAMASAVEVIDDMDVDQFTELGDTSEPLKAALVDNEKRHGFFEAMALKKKRSKAMEDSLAAYSIKAQLKPAIASFQEDHVSQVVDAALSTSIAGLELASVRCRRLQCTFCGLTDVALGMPLVRVPDEHEWNEMIPHLARSRRVALIAVVPETTDARSDMQRSSICAVTIRVDGDLFSVPDPSLTFIEDGGMLEFVPRADTAFHHEMFFRDESGLPFIKGSLSAHECCANAAHHGRKDLMIQRYKEKQAELVEKQAALQCGRTLEVGRDGAGRTYWQFKGDASALFVCTGMNDAGLYTWHRFGDPESVASVMAALRKDKLLSELRKLYPNAYSLFKTGKWVDNLLYRRYPDAINFLYEKDTDRKAKTAQADGNFDALSFAVGEQVVVETRAGSILWDATVVDVSIRQVANGAGKGMIDAYRVQFDGWGSHYTEWVDPSSIFVKNGTSISRQNELYEERASWTYGLPTLLNGLVAKSYLGSKDRARGSGSLPDFSRVAQAESAHTVNASTFAAVKAAVLAVEAALPVGSIDVTETGAWRPEYSNKWRELVQVSEGPAKLMACVILLEDTISPEWIKEDIGHLRSTLPARWKAIGEATPSSLAMRIILLDRSIMYGNIDRRRFRSRKKK